jgi:hypothetical protein
VAAPLFDPALDEPLSSPSVGSIVVLLIRLSPHLAVLGS